MQRSPRPLVLCLLLLGCAAAPVATRGVPAPARAPRVSLQVQALPAGAEDWRPVAPEDTLHSGDRLTLRVEVDEPAYVYVTQALPGGPPAVLFPKGEAQQARPG